MRISLAGAQEKTALLWHGGRWQLAHGATPTTHILKLPIGLVGHRQADFSTSVENEWLCMQLLEAFGLPVARTAMLRFGRQKVLAVERFDRRWHPSGRWIERLPQEDFCQALGLPPHLKYEADGGPGLPQLAAVLQGAAEPAKDLATLLRAQLLFWMLAAPDGHAKNFSLHLLARGSFALTPLYDVMSIWPVEGSGPNQFSWHRTHMAMALHGKSAHRRLRTIEPRHFDETAQRHFMRRDAQDLIESTLAQVESAIAMVAARLPGGFPAQAADAVFSGLRRAAKAMAPTRAPG